jgi:hypothetical protein
MPVFYKRDAQPLCRCD